MLRDEAEWAPRQPASMQSSLEDLIERSAFAGLTVRRVVRGAPRDLPATVDLAAFRIIQEATTNVLRHANTDHARVSIDYRPDALAVLIEDDGDGAPGPLAPGSGLRGMRERALALGGTVGAGASPAGGFRVARGPADTGHVHRGPAMIRVALADDQTLVRAGLRALLESEDDIAADDKAADGAEALEVVRATRPDVILMDIRMPGMDGLEATMQIGGGPSLRETRVVVLSTFDLDEYEFEALRNGASGFLVKTTERVELLRGLRSVAAGDALLSPGVTRQLIAEFAHRSRASPNPAALAALTAREREVMALVGEGLTNDEIAARLIMSPATAKTHVSRAMVKLHVRDRAQLVVLAYETGLVRPGWSG